MWFNVQHPSESHSQRIPAATQIGAAEFVDTQIQRCAPLCSCHLISRVVQSSSFPSKKPSYPQALFLAPPTVISTSTSSKQSSSAAMSSSPNDPARTCLPSLPPLTRAYRRVYNQKCTGRHKKPTGTEEIEDAPSTTGMPCSCASPLDPRARCSSCARHLPCSSCRSCKSRRIHTQTP